MQTVRWHGPELNVGENYSDSNQTVVELLNRFGADAWELAGIQDYREAEVGSSHSDASRLLTVYTFKRPRVPTGPKDTEVIQKGESPRSQSVRKDQSAHPKADDLTESQSAESATLVSFTVYLLRDRATDGRGSGQATVRLLIERKVADPHSQADIDMIKSFRVIYENSNANDDLREKIKAAAAAYASSRVESQLGDAWWKTAEGFPLSEAADLLNGSADWLRGLVEHPLANIASWAAAEGPIVPIDAGIAAEAVTAPLTAPLGSAARFCEVAGIALAMAMGAHQLAIACTKRLAHDELGEKLAEGIERILNSIFADRERVAGGARSMGRQGPSGSAETPRMPCIETPTARHIQSGGTSPLRLGTGSSGGARADRVSGGPGHDDDQSGPGGRVGDVDGGRVSDGPGHDDDQSGPGGRVGDVDGGRVSDGPGHDDDQSGPGGYPGGRA